MRLYSIFLIIFPSFLCAMKDEEKPSSPPSHLAWVKPLRDTSIEWSDLKPSTPESKLFFEENLETKEKRELYNSKLWEIPYHPENSPIAFFRNICLKNKNNEVKYLLDMKFPVDIKVESSIDNFINMVLAYLWPFDIANPTTIIQLLMDYKAHLAWSDKNNKNEIIFQIPNMLKRSVLKKSKVISSVEPVLNKLLNTIFSHPYAFGAFCEKEFEEKHALLKKQGFTLLLLQKKYPLQFTLLKDLTRYLIAQYATMLKREAVFHHYERAAIVRRAILNNQAILEDSAPTLDEIAAVQSTFESTLHSEIKRLGLDKKFIPDWSMKAELESVP